MKIQIPSHALQYMKSLQACKRSCSRVQRLTINEFHTFVATPELLAQPRLKPEPPADVIRVIDNAAEGGGSHE